MHIPLETAHSMLGIFGFARSTPAYERWVKPDGFAWEDFLTVVSESEYIFIIDWRAGLRDELEGIATALAKLGVTMTYHCDSDGSRCTASTGNGSVVVSYSPVDDTDFEDVIRALQSLLPYTIEFRAEVDNGGSDQWVFAVLPRNEWAQLEALQPNVISHWFRPLEPV